jgi:hypothetical protein
MNIPTTNLRVLILPVKVFSLIHSHGIIAGTVSLRGAECAVAQRHHDIMYVVYDILRVSHVMSQQSHSYLLCTSKFF